jgi:hypothetical protein
MKYPYEDMSPNQFEELVVLLCQNLLGAGVQGFATGTDGGRDAKFIGTAECFPSERSPWVGISIVQAKHTNGYNRSFSELDFFSRASTTTVIGKEIPRIRHLREAKQLDHYILFANRRLTGNAQSDIQAHIAASCGLPLSSVYLCGQEQLELWLKRYSSVAKLMNLDPVDSPLIISSDDLAEIVEAFARHKRQFAGGLDEPPIKRTSYEDKNRLNKMSPEYANEQRLRYLKETRQIQTFLSAPENRASLRLYESIVEEFQLKIIAKRKEYQDFDTVMNYLADLLFSRDPVLAQRSHKRITRAMLFFMYWNCDIGKSLDAAP